LPMPGPRDPAPVTIATLSASRSLMGAFHYSGGGKSSAP
jgi:hypothetical protein